MPPRSKEAATHHALSGESRQALLDVLRKRRDPIDATEAARAVGLHRNTAWVHLDVLARVGLVTRSLEERTARGRPGSCTGQPGQAPTAQVTCSMTPGTESSPACWRSSSPRSLTQGTRRHEPVDVGPPISELKTASDRAATPLEAVHIAVQILADLGFDPEPDPKYDPSRILLHRCPFVEVARQNPPSFAGSILGCSRPPSNASALPSR